MADLFPKHKLGRALGVYAIGAFIGSGLAFLIGGYVIGLLKDVSFVTLPMIGEIKTWQLTFMIVGLPGVLLALLMILTVREPERKGLKMDANGVAVKASFKNSIGFIKTHKNFLLSFYWLLFLHNDAVFPARLGTGLLHASLWPGCKPDRIYPWKYYSCRKYFRRPILWLAHRLLF